MISNDNNVLESAPLQMQHVAPSNSVMSRECCHDEYPQITSVAVMFTLIILTGQSYLDRLCNNTNGFCIYSFLSHVYQAVHKPIVSYHLEIPYLTIAIAYAKRKSRQIKELSFDLHNQSYICKYHTYH